MAATGKIDASTLSWVKAEIDETLKRARVALESFIEKPDDATRLRFCVTYLHQVVGTLQMVELDAPALLAREAELLAEALVTLPSSERADPFDLLTRTILTLPEYLSRLQYGQGVSPLQLADLVNEVRAFRKDPRDARAELFRPNLEIYPAVGVAAKDLGALGPAVRAARPRFQKLSLSWFKKPSVIAPLVAMAELCDELRAQAASGWLRQYFWVAGAFLEVLATGVDVTKERKLLVGKIEQQLKRIGDVPDEYALVPEVENLTRAMLYEIGGASAGGVRTDDVREAFHLGALFAGSSDASLEPLPSPEILHSVSAALAKEVESAQDLFASYIDPEHPQADALGTLRELLAKISRTSTMLGLGILRVLSEELAATVVELEQGRLALSDALSLRVAGAILQLDKGARDLGDLQRQRPAIEEHVNGLRALRGGAMAPGVDGIEISDAVLTDSEMQTLLGAVGAEIRANLTRVEEGFETFAANSKDTRPIQEVAAQLSQIQGALRILGQERAGELAGLIGQHVADLVHGLVRPGARVFESLAVGIGTIGAFLDGLERGRAGLDSLIDLALQDIDDSLTGALVPEAERSPEAAVRALLMREPFGPKEAGELRVAVMALKDDHLEPRVEKLAHEIEELLLFVESDGENLGPDVRRTLGRSIDTLLRLLLEDTPGSGVTPPLPGPTVAAVPPPVTRPEREKPRAPAPAAPPIEVEVDPEIREIFIEDARDVFANIDRELTQWIENPANKTALSEIRRGFHTLKGSGRMVGASEIAELSWDTESQLNQIREGRAHPSEELWAVLEEVRGALPLLIDALATDAPHGVDVEALRERVRRAGKTPLDLEVEAHDPPPVPEPRVVVAQGASVPIESVRAGSVPPSIPDPILRQIFLGEALTHLSIVHDQPETGGVPEAALLRAVHTLQGSSRAVGLIDMANCCFDLEKWLQASEAAGRPLADTDVAALHDTETAIRALLESIERSEMTPAELPALFQRLSSIFRERLNALTPSEPGQHSHTPVAPPRADAPRPPLHEPQAPRHETHVAPTLAGNGDGIVALHTGSSAKVADADSEDLSEADPELIDIFREEAADILETLESGLMAWRQGGGSQEPFRELKRALHTLKGGARMVSAFALGDLSHAMESLLREVEEGRIEMTDALFDDFEEAYDLLRSAVSSLTNGRTPVAAMRTLTARLSSAGGLPEVPISSPVAASQPAVSRESFERVPPVAATVSAPEPVVTFAVPIVPTETPSVLAPAAHTTPVPRHPEVPAGDAMGDADLPDAPAGADGDDGAPGERREVIKVRAELLDKLVNFAGEVSISRSRMEQQIFGLREHLGELQGNVTRFRDQLRDLEIQAESQILFRTETREGSTGQDFDPLEFDRFSRLQQLSRALSESLHDLSTIHTTLDNFAGEAETVLHQQARVNTELQEGLMRTRLVTFATQAGRLRHTVRQTARALGKRAELSLLGGEVELDKHVLDRMIGPLEHMIRNSLDHGIETEEERRSRHKSIIGRLTIHLHHQANEIVLRFSDDGNGLNVGAIRKRAVEAGLATADRTLSDEEAMQFILMPGFSTASSVTQVSGRGIGMDVVHSEVKQLGGAISVETEQGKGTTFVIRLPLTLSITQALMVKVHEQIYAVPLASVINIVEVEGDKLDALTGTEEPVLHFGGRVYPLMYLGTRLAAAIAPLKQKKCPILLVRVGTREVAVRVDGLATTREIVIKPLGPQLNEIKGLSGATILGDGEVVLILDVSELWVRDEGLSVLRIYPAVEATEVPASRRPTVMVVDDSLTVRKVTSKHLQKRGYEVMVAKDGIEALEQVRDQKPDIMLVDIEMPRMDGYELTRTVRGSAELAQIPVIMITSRAGDKHRDYALKLGVNVYLSKPYQEDDLVEHIAQLLTARGVATP